MSVLDEAFIKAYRKRTQPPAARNLAPAARPAANERGPQASLHSRGETVPQPHVAFASAAQRSNVERSGAERPSLERPAAERASAERPAAERPAAERPAPERAEAEAAFEVPHFIWPSVVTELLARAPAELSRVSTWLSALVDRSPKVVLMAGMMRGEGRTTVMLALAQAAAQRHLRTVLVDLDFFKPELADRLGIIAQVGGEEVFAGDLPLGDAMVQSVAEPLAVLPLVRPLVDPDRVVGNRRVSAALQTLRRSHDLVLVDAPPLDSDAQAIDLAAILAGSIVQDAVVVRDPQRMAASEIRLISRRLAAAGVSRWHIIENFVQAA